MVILPYFKRPVIFGTHGQEVLAIQGGFEYVTDTLLVEPDHVRLLPKLLSVYFALPHLPCSDASLPTRSLFLVKLEMIMIPFFLVHYLYTIPFIMMAQYGE